MPEISIIVPIFNSEKYLNYCIESLLNQTFTDIEVILINDGSTDNSLYICQEYAKIDNRIKVINQQNAGVSAARNNGLKYSVGKFIMFCDSDDTVSPYWCEAMHKSILIYPYALNVSNVTRDKNCLTKTNPDINNSTSEINYYHLFKIALSGYTPNKIFDASIIKSNDIKFDIKYSIGEDVKFIIEYLQYCNKIVYIESKLYYYNSVESSITQKYNYNAFNSFLMPFYVRINHIDNKFFTEYCDAWLHHFINLFDNIFDKRNTKMTLLSKFKYNNRMIKTEEFQYCVENSSENKLVKFILKTKNYYIFWLFQILIKIKSKIKG